MFNYVGNCALINLPVRWYIPVKYKFIIKSTIPTFIATYVTIRFTGKCITDANKSKMNYTIVVFSH